VVYSERRSRVDDDNFGTLYEQLNATAFSAHPYAWPVVGWASDIEGWTMDDLKEHYRIGYAPNNCVMVVTGDVDAAEVLGLAKKYFGPIPRQEPPPPVRTREPRQPGERRATVHRAAQLPLLMASYHVPETASPESPAIAVLNQILSEGRSSRLYRRLVDGDQLALSVQIFTDFSLDPGQFIAYVEPRSGAALDRVEAVLYEELERAGQEGVRPEEVQKAKNQILADLYRGFKTIAGKANLLGRYEVFYGDHRRLFTAAADLEKVTPEQVAEVARKYLAPGNRTVALLIPEARSAEPAGAQRSGESQPASEVRK
jgi:zinc protease